MTNYTQTNIYRRQMQELGLNTKEYAELLKIPYEVVKDIIYDKEGDYSMEVKDLLRQTMFNRHQDIENNYENAKFDAMQIKRNEIDYLEWYDKEYSFDLLKKKLNIHSISEFKRKYNLIVREKRASEWFYNSLTSKTNYKDRQIATDVIEEFSRQLYDIIVNDNGEAYLLENEIKIEKPVKHYSIKEQKEKEKWFKEFNVKAFMKENNITTKELAEELNLAYSTLCQFVAKTHYGKGTVFKFYDFVKSIEDETNEEKELELNEEENKTFTKLEEQPKIENKLFDEVLEEEDIEKLKETPQIIKTYQEPKIEIINNNDDILRKILINRLTDEEKELIRIFGGKLN